MKSREVGLGVKASQRLFKYIHLYRKANRNERHVFVGYTGNPLTTNSAAQIMERLLGWAGVEHGRCTHVVIRWLLTIFVLVVTSSIFNAC